MSPEKILLHYQRHVAETDPDVVVILASDFNFDVRRVARDKGLSARQYRPSWFTEILLLWKLIKKNMAVIQLLRSAHIEHRKPQINPLIIVALFGDRLRNLVDIVGNEGRRVVLLNNARRLRADQSPGEQLGAASYRLPLFPYMTVQGFLDVYAAYSRVVTKTANETGALLIDPRPFLRSEHGHFVDFTHTTPLGSSVLGKLVAERLIADPEFKKLVEERSPGCLQP